MSWSWLSWICNWVVYGAELSCADIDYAVQGRFNFWVCEWNPMVWPFKWKLLFIMPHKVVLTFESVNEIQWRDHSNESYWAILSCGTDYYTIQGGYNFFEWNPKKWILEWRQVRGTFLLYCYLCCPKESFLLILLIKVSTCYHSNESYWAVLSCGTVYCSVHGGFNVWVHGWNPVVLPLKWDLVSRTFACYCLLRCVKWHLQFFFHMAFLLNF